jgi:hypothetical protein
MGRGDGQRGIAQRSRNIYLGVRDSHTSLSKLQIRGDTFGYRARFEE